MRKVVLHDILSQIVQKLGFIIWLWPSWRPSWRPSWISPLAQKFSLADFYYRGANDAKSTVKKTLSFQAGYTWVAP